MKGDRGRSKLQRKRENKGSSELPANWFWFYEAVHSHLGVATGLYPIRRWFGLPDLVVSGNKSTKRKWTRFNNILKILLRLKKAPPLLKDSRFNPLSQHTRRVRTEFIHYKLFIGVFSLLN